MMENDHSIDRSRTSGTESDQGLQESNDSLEAGDDRWPADEHVGGDAVEGSSEVGVGDPMSRPIPDRSLSGDEDKDEGERSTRVLVLGSGYAGAGAIKRLEARLDESATLTWVSDVDHHLLLHESHRIIRDPDLRNRIAVPIEEITRPGTRFVHAEVTDVDTAGRRVDLAGGSTIGYDYLVVALGSRTAFFGVDGLEEHALMLDSLDDALAVHDALETAASEASEGDPARVIVGGAGLAGVQCAGEIAAFRDECGAPLEITLVEGSTHVHPNGDPELQGRIRKHLRERDIGLETRTFIRTADETTVHLDDGGELAYDVLLWTGGVTARHAVEMLCDDEDHHRVPVASTFETDDDRVFAIGDSAFVPGENETPPTAQAAQQAARVAAENVIRAMRDRRFETWRYRHRGTLVSIGDATVAHEVDGIPLTTFGGPVARFLKRTVTALWLARIAGPARALRSW